MADELPRLGVQLGLVASLQELDEAAHGVKRLAEVVRGDGGELVEVAVRASELLGLDGQVMLGLRERMLELVARLAPTARRERAGDGASGCA